MFSLKEKNYVASRYKEGCIERSYDPRYDPLKPKAKASSAGQEYAPTYWVDHVDSLPDDDGRFSGSLNTEVLIIGAGFTGLSCAMHLAQKHGVQATVLEANQTAWGCTSRNGGAG